MPTEIRHYKLCSNGTESSSSSTGSRLSSGKRHQSGSCSRDEADSKKGQQMAMEDQNHLAPVAGIHRPTLDWSQDILEPWKQMWKPAAGDALATARQTLKSVVKLLGKLALAEPTSCSKINPWTKPALVELASCGKGRGQTITEKLQEIANLGPAGASWYTGNDESWKNWCPRDLPFQIRKNKRLADGMRNEKIRS